MRETSKRSWLWFTVAVAILAVPFAVVHAAPRWFEVQRFFAPGPDGVIPTDPFLANGVAVGRDNAIYWAAGTGPAAKNTLAAVDTPEQFIDYALIAAIFPDFAPTDADKAAGALPEGMTLTEAQGLNCLARVQENLTAAELTLTDVTYMRIFVDNPADAARADYAGWNRAYRKFMANVDLETGALIEAYAPVLFENATRPARSNIEVATLPVLGWLIEIEAIAVYPRS